MSKKFMGFVKKNCRKRMYLIVVISLLFASYLSAQSRRDTTPGGRLGGGSGSSSIPELVLGAPPVHATIIAGQENWYSVRTTSTGFLVLETHGNELDTYLELFDENQNLVTEDDDGGEWLNARIEMYVVANRAFNVKVRAYSDTVGGSYSISAHLQTISPATDLTFGRIIRRNLEADTEHWYRIITAERSFITVETMGDIVETVMDVFDANYNHLMNNNYGGYTVNSQVELFVVPNQTYYFRVKASNRNSSGEYRILSHYEVIPPDAGNTVRTRATNLRLGADPLSVFFLAENEARWFQFETPRGGATITVTTTGELDTYLTIFDNNGNHLFSDDDSGEGLNAYISERLNQGTYYIEVKPFRGNIGRTILHTEINR